MTAVPTARMTTKRSVAASLFRRLFTMFLVVVLAILLLEGGVRLMADLFGLAPYMRYDSEIGWSTRPGTEKRHVDPEGQFDVTYYINAQGYRGPNYSVERKHGRYRILILGDSTGFGWGVSQEETLAGILDAELQDTEVINLALSGFGIDQSYLRFVKEGAALKPDMVILQVSHNDFEEIMTSFFNGKPKPRFLQSNDGELRLTNVPVRAEGEAAKEFYRNSLPVPAKEWLGWHSYSFNLLNGLYYGMRRGNRPTTGPAHSIYTRESVALFNAIIGQLEDHIRAGGAQGLIVHAVKEVSEQSLIQASAMPVLDLYRSFQSDGGGSAGNCYFSDGYHWNQRGHRIAADKVKPVIEALRLRH